MRPIHTSTLFTSAVRSCLSFSEEFSKNGEGPMDTRTFLPLFSTFSTVRFTINLILRFFISLCRILEQSSSTDGSGRIRGMASTTVTWDPKDERMNANSHPTTPPPTIITDSGISSMLSASLLLIILLPSKGKDGTANGSEPKARISLSHGASSTVLSFNLTSASPAPFIYPYPFK